MTPGVATRRVAHGSSPRRRPLYVRWTGFVGELLLTAGVLLGLFVVWQLFWTDVEASQDQQEAVEQIQESFTPPPAEPDPGPRTGAPPVMNAPAHGEDLGLLYVPRWGEDYQLPIAEGDDLPVLNEGAAGHRQGTAMPGEVGNFALAAHRQTYGAAFHHIDQLETSDRIIVWTKEAWLVYRVTDSYIVASDQTEVVAPVPGEPGAEATDRMITLITCHPLWSTAERWIVHGELVEWYPPSDPRDGLPEPLREGG
ncbi:class E sortase [Georgenia halophila]|uniref:Class E sortase n=1 Tax=Georgenia halophila TaxID=620889 RepID=A0ABP8LBU0_9MICO